MNLRGYLTALAKNWWIVLLMTVLATVGAAAYTVSLDRVYQSTVTFFVNTAKDTNALQSDQFAQQRVNSYIQLLSTESLARTVIADTGLTVPPSSVMSQIVGSADTSTVLLTASVRAPSPERSLLIADSIARTFGPMVEQLETPQGGDQSLVKLQVVSGPTLNPTPVSPRTSVYVTLGFLAGLGLGVLLAVLRETLDTTLRTATALQGLTDTPVLGLIGLDKLAQKQPLIVDSAASSPRSEEYRRLRTNLQFVDLAQPVRTIVVTSAVAGEGKSTVSVNLAIAFADLDLRVLLIEGDLRRPRVADLLGVERAVGLTNVLAHQADINDVLQPWGRGGLTVLPSGTIPPNPSELLGSPLMADLLASLRAAFDMIIIDTPPLLPVTDAAVAAAQVDGAVLVVRHGKTKRAQVLQSVQALTAVDARILGTVMTQVPTRRTVSY